MAFIESGKKQSGGSGGHIILDNEGISLTQRDDLQFKGAYSEDDSTNETTVVNVVRSMTYAEFQQLSDDEKQGIINVTDVTGGEENKFQPVIYSEEEREIGVWVDGRPLYQNTLYIASITGPDTTVAHGISNLDWIVDYSLIGLYAGETKEIAPSSGSYSTIGVVLGSWDSTNIQFNVGNLSYGFSDCYLTIKYTKSSDSAGSGQWTPQGVPAVHYSTDEHIVGTWIDGNTLYEKTLQLTNVSMNVGWAVIGNIPNIAKLVSCNQQELVPSESIYGYTGLPAVYYYNSGNIALYNFLGGTMGTVSGYVTVRYTKKSA